MLSSFEQIGTIELRNSESRPDAEVSCTRGMRDGAGFFIKKKKTLTLHKRPKIGPSFARPLELLFSVLFFMARIKLYFLL